MTFRDLTLARPLALLVSLAALGCGGEDGGDGGSGETTSSLETTFGGHSATDPTNSSLTFTNSSDPTDASLTTTDPSDPTDASLTTTDPSDPTATTTDDPSATGDSTGDVTATTGDVSVTDSESVTDSASETGNPGGACCEEQEQAGCGDASIEACVCAQESFCCDVQWDVVCTVQTVLLGCAECPGIGGDGDCCAAHGNPGCDDEQVEQCVCNEDYVCCVDPWDEICVGIAMNTCGAC